MDGHEQDASNDAPGREPVSDHHLSRREFARRAGFGSAAAAGLVWAAPKISTVKYVSRAAIGSTGPKGSTEPATPIGPLGNELSLSATSPCVGDSLQVTATGFAPGTGVAIQIDGSSTPIGMATADPAGTIDVPVVLPKDGPTGVHTLKAVGVAPGGRVLTLSAQIAIKTEAECAASESAIDPTVGAQGFDAGSGGGSLPFTGGETTDLIVMGGGAVIGGRALYEMSKRRAAKLDDTE